MKRNQPIKTILDVPAFGVSSIDFGMVTLQAGRQVSGGFLDGV